MSLVPVQYMYLRYAVNRKICELNQFQINNKKLIFLNLFALLNCYNTVCLYNSNIYGKLFGNDLFDLLTAFMIMIAVTYHILYTYIWCIGMDITTIVDTN